MDEEVKQEQEQALPDLGEVEWFIVVPLGFAMVALASILTKLGCLQWVDGQSAAACNYWIYALFLCGGALNPINTIWLGLPFTSKPVIKSPPFARCSGIFFVLAALLWLTSWFICPPVAPLFK